MAACGGSEQTTDAGVVINGAKWATRNVDKVGKLAATTQKCWQVLPMEQKKDVVAEGEVADWDRSMSTYETWEKAKLVLALPSAAENLFKEYQKVKF